MASTFEDLGGKVHYLRRLVDKDDKTWSAFNASIGISDSGSLLVALRSSNYVILPHGELHVVTGGPIRNQVWLADLDDSYKLQNLRKVDFSKSGRDFPRGIEDPKLLWRDKKWMFTGVAMERDIPVARNCVCYLDKKTEQVTKVEILPGFETKRAEKNWMTAYKKPVNFDYVYDGNAIVKGDKLIHWLRDNKKLSSLRGNAHLWELEDGTYLGIMHTLGTTKTHVFSPTTFGYIDNVQKDYDHYFVRFNEDGWAIEISEPFKFIGKGIEFAAGIVAKGDEYLITFGKDDIFSHLAVIDKSKVHKMLKSVD